ncbi:MAG: MFS transporter [Bacteroidales bacterium]|nr:MFS transporter [Bacteroidales bacterium]
MKTSGSAPKEKLWNSNYIKVMATNFTLFFAFYLLTPLLPLYLSETFNATKDMIGLVLSGYTLVAILMRPFSGFLVDSFPRKKVLLICLFVCFLFFGSYLVAGSLMLFAVIRTLHGGPFGACTVANSTMAIDVLPSSRRNEGIGFYGISNNLASAIAPTVAIFIYHYVNDFDVLFWLAFIVAGLGLISAAMLEVTPKPIEKKNRKLSLDRFFLLRGWFLALNLCFFGFCWGVMSNYLAIYSKERLGITSGTGTFFMILSAGLILSRLWGNKTLREGKLTHNALEGIILSTLGYTTFIAYPSMTGYYIAAALIGLGNGHIWPAFQNMIIAIARHDERGTANSTILTSWDLGIGLGVLLGGVIAEYCGYNAIFWMIAAVHVAGLITFIVLTRKKFGRVSVNVK